MYTLQTEQFIREYLKKIKKISVFSFFILLAKSKQTKPDMLKT